MNGSAAVVVESVQGPALVQDGGRHGTMHHGLPPGGALVPELLAATQSALGHAWNEPAVEIFGGLAIRAVRDVRVSLDGEVRALAKGEVFAIRPAEDTVVRYLAFDRVLDVPTVLGGRGTLVSASVGGFEGRALRRGDVLATRGEARARVRLRARNVANHLASEAPFRIVRGPDLARFAPDAFATLVRERFPIGTESDRVGTRLEGPPLARVDRDDAGSRPMVRGAIEVPASGRAIVLGPDHPITGGYPVLAVVARADHGRFAARRAGATIRFVEVTVEEARAAWTDHAARWFNVGL